MRIGLFGGSFDPIHLGHLIVAEATREELSLDEILFSPARLPPHKPPCRASDQDRWAMVELAVADHASFRAVDLEMQRQGPSYTIDTIHQLAEQLEPADEIILITGLDAFLEIETWHRHRELLALCGTAVLTRPGADPSALDRMPPWLQHLRLSGRIDLLEVPAIQISSSDLRLRIAGKRSIRYLVHPAVEGYIHRRGLYQRASD